MAAEPNWHKQVAIGTWILIVLTSILIILGIITFFHPPDPAHPMSLDFLSRDISISPWFALVIALVLVGGTAESVRRRSLRSTQLNVAATKKLIEGQRDQYELQLSQLQDQNKNLQTNGRTLAGVNDILEMQKSALMKKNESLHGELTALKVTLKNVEEARDMRAKETAAWPKQYDDCDKDRAILRAERDRLSKELDDLKVAYGQRIIEQSELRQLMRVPPLIPQPVEGNTTIKADLSVIRKPFEWNPSVKSTTIRWPDGVYIQIEFYTSDTYGLVVYVANCSVFDIPAFALHVAEAASWSESNHDFLPSRNINELVYQGSSLEAMQRTERGKWLVRVLQDGLSCRLAVGSSNASLKWQNDEPNPVQIWRLKLMMTLYKTGAPHLTQPQTLEPIYLVIRWNETEKNIAMIGPQNERRDLESVSLRHDVIGDVAQEK